MGGAQAGQGRRVSSARENPDELAEQLGRESDELEKRSEQLKERVAETRQDWERKRSDPGVPGAPPPETGGQEPEAEFPAKAESREGADDSAA